MDNNDPQPETEPAGNRQPPRPPNRAAIGLGSEGDDSNKNCPATITKPSYGEGRFIRQSGGRAHYGHVKVNIHPNKRGKGIEVIDDVQDDAIPAALVKHVIRGVHATLDGGMDIGDPEVDGHPVVDIVVRVIDGSFHETESSEFAFIMAGMIAVKEAIKKGNPFVIK